MKLEKTTVYMRPAIACQLRVTAAAQGRSISSLVQDCVVKGIAGAFEGSPEAAPLNETEIWAIEKGKL